MMIADDAFDGSEHETHRSVADLGEDLRRVRHRAVEEIRLVTEREVSEIQIEGQPMFIEARLRVTAKGRPRIATG